MEDLKCRIWGRGIAREGEGGHGEGVRGRGSARGGERVSCERDRESEVASHFSERGPSGTTGLTGDSHRSNRSGPS